MDIACDFDESLFSEFEVKDKRIPKVILYNAKICESQWYEEICPEETSEIANIWKYRAEAAYIAKNYRNALQCFEKSKEFFSTFNGCLNRDLVESIARCHLHLGEGPQALTAARILDNSAQNYEQKTSSLNLLLDIQQFFAHTEDELHTLHSLIFLHPLNAHLWIRLAKIYLLTAATDKNLELRSTETCDVACLNCLRKECAMHYLNQSDNSICENNHDLKVANSNCDISSDGDKDDSQIGHQIFQSDNYANGEIEHRKQFHLCFNGHRPKLLYESQLQGFISSTTGKPCCKNCVINGHEFDGVTNNGDDMEFSESAFAAVAAYDEDIDSHETSGNSQTKVSCTTNGIAKKCVCKDIERRCRQEMKAFVCLSRASILLRTSMNGVGSFAKDKHLWLLQETDLDLSHFTNIPSHIQFKIKKFVENDLKKLAAVSSLSENLEETSSVKGLEGTLSDAEKYKVIETNMNLEEDFEERFFACILHE